METITPVGTRGADKIASIKIEGRGASPIPFAPWTLSYLRSGLELERGIKEILEHATTTFL
jgi:hypothetical protein